MRRTVLLGALISVVLGVALVQSSLLLLISAATMHAPAGLDAVGRMTFDENATAAVSLLGIVLGISTFLAAFIVSSTFAFTVNQRRRDMALLRLVGSSRGQVGRKLLGEAVLLGGLGAVIGVPVGLGVAAVQVRLLIASGFAPAGFHAEWRTWILAVSLGTGVVLSVAGAMAAARRAGKVRPLEALRDTGDAARVMTVSRWVFGLLFAGGALAMVIVAPHAGVVGGVAVTENIAMPAGIALAALAPLLVPVVGRLIPSGGSVTGTVARANLRDAKRRSASVAAPLIVLFGLVLALPGASQSFTAAGIGELRAHTRADLVLEAVGPIDAAVRAVPGVASASTEASVPVTLGTGHGEDAESNTVEALAIDPASYVAAHPGSDAIAKLHGRAVAGGPGGDVPAHGSVRVELPGTNLGTLSVAASLPASMSGGADLLLPRDLVPAALLATAPTRSLVTLAPGADAAAARSRLAALGTVSNLDDWLTADAKARNTTNNRIMVIIMGLGGLYTLIGIINAVAIGASTRRREFAAARVTGFTRGQVVRSALVESWAVTLCGLVLGALAAGATFVAVLATTSAVTGTATLDLPWTLILAVTAAAVAVTSAASVVTSWFATRSAPVALLGAAE